MDVTPGRVAYTPLLTPRGGIKADLTVMRLADRHFRVVTGGAHEDHLPDSGSVHLADLTSAVCTIGVWGPRARDLVRAASDDDFSNAGFPFATCRPVAFGNVRVLASRISYVGELGWELYLPMEQGARLWDRLWEAGQAFGVLPVGIGVYATTGRLEKSYRAYGNELEQEFNLVETGLARAAIKPQDFIGKAAYLAQRAEAPAAILCTLTVDDHASKSGKSGQPGVKRYMLGREPILGLDGAPLADRHGRRSYVTSAGAGPSVGKHILMAFLPPEHARPGQKLVVEYMGEHYPVTVAVAGSQPLFDPDNRRLKS
jgi:glycine cleavage system aminomethyltransferase T